jgi:hypothetical protein
MQGNGALPIIIVRQNKSLSRNHEAIRSAKIERIAIPSEKKLTTIPIDPDLP